MRWDRLFADLDAQLERAERDEVEAEVADRVRVEVGRIDLSTRLAAAVGETLGVTAAGGLTLRGLLSGVGPDWLLLTAERGQQWLISRGAVSSIQGLPLRSAAQEPTEAKRVLAARLDLRQALRGITRDRAEVRLHLSDATVLDGTLDRVAADHVDLAQHPAGEFRRARAVRQVHTVPLVGLSAVSRTRLD